jgi:hypothetical protein
MSDNENVWTCIYKTTSLFEAETIKGNLEHAQIDAVILNKRDSSYLNFGYIEIHVPSLQEKKAAQLLNENNSNEE